MNAELLMNGVLRAHPHGHDLAEIMAAALDAVEPGEAVRRALRSETDGIFVGERRFALKSSGRVIVVGAGKAGAPMTEAAVAVLGDRVSAGAVVVKEGHLGATGARIGNVELFEAGHPLPDARGVAAAERLAALAAEASADDLLLVLISGGGSALLTLPAPGLSLADVRQVTTTLLACGATINELNALRKHCLQLAGGRLAQLAQPAQVAALIISDVVGSPLDVIASGPTAPDPTTYKDAWDVISRYRIEDDLPASIINYLRRGLAGDVPDTPKSSAPFWEQVSNSVVASNVTAAEAAIAAARERGFDAQLLTTFLEGEAREVGRVAASIARELARGGGRNRATLIVAGGETTVTLRGQGRGGRNQELVLGAVEGLAGLEGALVVALATDGGDGPTDAAGAVVTGEALARARALGIEPNAFLRDSNSYNFFDRLDALLRPGPTLTNVNDLLFICVASQAD